MRTRYSLISAGTELAALAPTQGSPVGVGDLRARSAAAGRLLARAMQDPRKATRRVVTLARGRVARAFPSAPQTVPAPVSAGQLMWAASSAAKLEAGPDGSLLIVRDARPTRTRRCQHRSKCRPGMHPQYASGVRWTESRYW